MRGDSNTFLIGLCVCVIILLTVYFIRNITNFSAGKAEQFADYNNTIPIQSNQDFVSQTAAENNLANSLLNPYNPALPPSPDIKTASIQALNTTAVNSGGLPGAFSLSPPSSPLQLNSTSSELLAKIKFCETYATTTDCSVWNNSQFSRDCGLSFDINGTDYQGNPHMGGLYVGQDEKNLQLQESEGKPNREDTYKPTFGIAKKGYFALDAASCQVIQEKIACMSKKSFDVQNCSQCYVKNSWNRLDQNSVRLKPTLYLGGSFDSITITKNGNQYSWTPSGKNTIDAIEFERNGLGSLTEGTSFLLDVKGAKPYVYGYLESTTKKVDPYRIELTPLIDVDQVSGNRPAIMGQTTINTVKMNRIIPSVGRTGMKLLVRVPFSFVSTDDDSAAICDNSPFITQKASADFLNSNPCYGPNATPGNYGLDCLKEMFLSVGGNQNGTGFPKNATAAKAINYDSATGQPRDLPSIGDFLYNMSVRAATGMDIEGNKLSVDDWNTASMFMLGKKVSSPCNGQESLPANALNQECLQFIYRNQGAGGDFGSTYTADYTLSSLLGKNPGERGNTYCQPGAPLDPATDSGKAALAKLATIQDVKNLYNQTHKTANDNSLSVFDRSSQIKNCYNVSIVPPLQEEPYLAGEVGTYDEAVTLAKNMGGRLATLQQALATRELGGMMCGMFPIAWVEEKLTILVVGNHCGNKDPPLIFNPPPTEKAGRALIYGIKPTENSEEAINNKVRPFNSETNQWNSKEVFLTFFAKNITHDEGMELCKKYGYTPATKDQLKMYLNAGGQVCNWTWVADDSTTTYLPMQVFENRGFCSSPGLNVAKQDKGWGVFCYGTKPNKKVGGPFIVSAYQGVNKDTNQYYSIYDYWAKYQPVLAQISDGTFHQIHPWYMPLVDNSPKKVMIYAVASGSDYVFAISAANQKFVSSKTQSSDNKAIFNLLPMLTTNKVDWENCQVPTVIRNYTDNNATNDMCVNKQQCFDGKMKMCYNNRGTCGFYIQNYTNHFVSAIPEGPTLIKVPWQLSWEFWMVEPYKNNVNSKSVVIKSYHGKYLSYKGNNQELTTEATEAGPNEEFMLFAVN